MYSKQGENLVGPGCNGLLCGLCLLIEGGACWGDKQERWLNRLR